MTGAAAVVIDADGLNQSAAQKQDAELIKLPAAVPGRHKVIDCQFVEVREKHIENGDDDIQKRQPHQILLLAAQQAEDALPEMGIERIRVVLLFFKGTDTHNSAPPFT